MARFALINSQGGIDRMSSSISPDVQTKSGWKWLPCDSVAQPSFDLATETIDGPTYTVGETAVTEVWTKRSLTAEEISDRKDNAVGGLNGSLYPALAKVLLNHENRIRDLEAKSAVTMVQFKAGIKALL